MFVLLLLSYYLNLNRCNRLLTSCAQVVVKFALELVGKPILEPVQRRWITSQDDGRIVLNREQKRLLDKGVIGGRWNGRLDTFKHVLPEFL